MQSYPLDLKTLLHLLSRKKQSGQLYARQVKVVHIKEPLQAHLTLINGEVQSCLLLTMSSDVYVDEGKAFQLLMQSGIIEWQWHEGNPVQASPVAVSPPIVTPPPSQTPQVKEPSQTKDTLPLQGSSAPRRVMATNEVFNALSRAERKILMLMDGSRTVYEIAGMLSLNEREELLNVLRELHRKGLFILQ